MAALRGTKGVGAARHPQHRRRESQETTNMLLLFTDAKSVRNDISKNTDNEKLFFPVELTTSKRIRTRLIHINSAQC